MIYFIGYTDSPGNWTGCFTRAVRDALKNKEIPFIELPPYDWYTNPYEVRKEEYLAIDSKEDDVWFVGWAQSPAIEIIKNKKGKKLGLVVGLTAMPFEPMVLWEAGETLKENIRLRIYDKILANSHWCKKCITNAYPDLMDKVVVTGFPIDFEVFESLLNVPKDKKLVVFNQRFNLEKLHILEVEVARRLIKKGYRVQHLSGIPYEELANQAVTTRTLITIARSIGMEMVFNPTKEIYHKNLAKASIVITTSIADMLPSSLIEAVHLGAVPVAPNNLCFPEFIHRDNLYQPYDIDEIINIVEERPIRAHSIYKYESNNVLTNILKEIDTLRQV
jgi:glycosyltransferase involved in cell wall biosynthesis